MMPCRENATHAGRFSRTFKGLFQVMKLLISVRDHCEARAALAGGADIIDVKEPLHGSLGRADPATWRAVQSVVGSTRKLSVALGELCDVSPRVLRLIPSGCRWAKVGLARCDGCDWPERLRVFFDDAPAHVQPVVATYADHPAQAPAPESVLAFAQETTWPMLLDTYTKDGRSVHDWLGWPRLVRLIQNARACGVPLALAGSLRAAHLPVLAERLAERTGEALVLPWCVAFRGAACDGGRTGRISSARVAELRAAVRAMTAPCV